MRAQHTPKPWATYWNSKKSIVIRKMFPDGQEAHQIATVVSGADDALVIVVAPELLDALARLVGQCDRLRLPGQAKTDAEKNAEAVIAKATAWSAPTVQHLPSKDTEGGEI